MMDEATRELGIERISASMARFRMLIGRRVIGRLALANVAPALEISDLDVIALVPDRPRCVEAAAEEVSVGDIARQLRIDPSRASRLVARLVEQGFLVRTVAQADARRAVLRRSPAGDRIFAEIRHVKLDLIREITADWTKERLALFAEGFEDFTLALEERVRSEKTDEPELDHPPQRAG